jgi:hypothetical protein
MHVPQAGYQEFTRGIDDACARRGLDTLADCSDAAVGDRDRDVFARRSPRCVNDRGVLKDDALRNRALSNRALSERKRQEGSETEQPEEQTDPTSCLASD